MGLPVYLLLYMIVYQAAQTLSATLNPNPRIRAGAEVR